MPEITVNLPSLNLIAYFTFKEPVNTHFKNKYNLNSLNKKLKVISIIGMKDMIRNDLKDPYMNIYVPLGINSEVEYKKDLNDNIPIISFSFKDNLEVERYLRCPLNYIESYTLVSDIEYINKVIVLDLGMLPKDLDISMFYNDFKDYIETRIGVNPELKEIEIGNIELVSESEHTTRETIRNNTKTVYKTCYTLYEEEKSKNTELLLRLQSLGISLG